MGIKVTKERWNDGTVAKEKYDMKEKKKNCKKEELAWGVFSPCR